MLLTRTSPKIAAAKTITVFVDVNGISLTTYGKAIRGRGVFTGAARGHQRCGRISFSRFGFRASGTVYDIIVSTGRSSRVWRIRIACGVQGRRSITSIREYAIWCIASSVTTYRIAAGRITRRIAIVIATVAIPSTSANATISIGSVGCIIVAGKRSCMRQITWQRIVIDCRIRQWSIRQTITITIAIAISIRITSVSIAIRRITIRVTLSFGITIPIPITISISIAIDTDWIPI